MMRIGVIAFSAKGGALGRGLVQEFSQIGCTAEGFLTARHKAAGMQPFTDLSGLVCTLFEKEDIIIFVGACGIAVRTIAPYIKSKMEDPGILVVDECGKYVISLLSGHVGRANYVTNITAQILDAEPVITTATDRNGVFAVDEWAVSNHLRILDAASIKEISSRLLSGKKVGFYSDFPIAGRLPEGLTKDEDAEAGIVVSYEKKAVRNRFQVTCHLLPMDLVVGVGCRSGKPFSQLQAFLMETFEKYQLSSQRIGKLCSVSIKENEEGLKKLAASLRVPFETFHVKQLETAEGVFGASDFVEKHIGVDNVCERSACLGSGNGKKLVGKQAFDGMTLAVYQRQLFLTF